MPSKIETAGAPLQTARTAVVLVHGRGASAASILDLARDLAPTGTAAARDTAFLAPQAPGFSWYPYSFLAPITQNEPHLTNALQILTDLMTDLESSGITRERVLLVGFSQGACLSLEFVARNARHYGGVFGLSGGLIGPPGSEHNYPGNLAGTPVFLGCSDVDPHIPLARVHETAQALAIMGAQVETRIYPGMGHTVNEDEINYARRTLEKLIAFPRAVSKP